MEILRIRNAAGEWEEVPALIGPAGADGLPGADGISPSVTIESTDEGAVITIVDATGSSSATLLHGAQGQTPVKGTDYWTEEDKAEIVSDVLAALPQAEEVSV